MTECVFCQIVTGRLASHRVHEDDATVAFMDVGQVNPGHVIVAVKAHVQTILGLTADQAAAAFRATARVARLVHAALGPEGLTILQGNGREGWQTVPHFHCHVLPRHANDGHVHREPRRPERGDLELDWAPHHHGQHVHGEPRVPGEHARRRRRHRERRPVEETQPR